MAPAPPAARSTPRTSSSRRWPASELRCIGSTTYKEFRNYFEKDRALVRRFQKIDVPEPTEDEAVKILEGLRPSYEAHHQVRYTAGALDAAVKLSTRYMHDRKLPDKAIDVIDEVGAAQMLRPVHLRKKTIKARDIEEIVAKMTRVPIKTVNARDRDHCARWTRTSRPPCSARTRRSRRWPPRSSSAARACATSKPIGCYLFSGPTGVGKTEVAKQLAKVMGVELIGSTCPSTWSGTPSR